MRYRIACFSMHYLPKADSEAYVTAKWVNALKSQGHTIDVFNYMEPSINISHNGRLGILIRDILRYTVLARKYDTMDLSQMGLMTSYVHDALESFQKKHYEQPYDFIVSRYEPIGSAIAAFWASQLTGLPWIASYNDPLPRRMPSRQGLIGLWDMHRRRFQEKWTSKLLGIPNWLVFPSSRMKEWILNCDNSANYNLQTFVSRSSVIPHIGGPVDSEGSSIENEKPIGENVYNIRHIGYLSSLRNPATFLTALELWENTPGLPSIKVEFIGNTTAQKSKLNSFLAVPKTKVELRLLPEVSQQESFYLMQTADVCLLIEEPAKESIFLPSKFCDYAVAETPILAITCEDATVADYLRQYSGGQIAGHNRPHEVFVALQNLYNTDRLQSKRLANQFTSVSIAKNWEKLFQNLAANREQNAEK